MKICVFCSSSNSIDSKYHQIAKELGKQIAEIKATLYHGGGKVGLMGQISKSTKENGGKVIGVIPEKLNIKGIVSETDDEIVVTKDMTERKQFLRTHADAFIALPGGFGTMEELVEVITLKQLKYHDKPIVILNVFGFYDKFLEWVNHFYNEKFADKAFKNIYLITDSVENCMDYISNYQSSQIPDKWQIEIENAKN